MRDDKVTETRFSEIKLRAVIKIGELSRELETARPNKGHGVAIDGKTKKQALSEAGIPVRTAHNYEELAGPRLVVFACTHFNALRCRWAVLVISTGMQSPDQQNDDELLERAKRLAGQFSDPRIVPILSALLIADAIRRAGRITEVIAENG